MRNTVIGMSFLAVLVLLAGCGTLDQKVGGPQLSKPAMEFADKLKDGESFMSITSGEETLSTKKWASRVYPIFPIIYWSTLGNLYPAPNYGVRTSTVFFPVFVVVRDSVYSDRGDRLSAETMFNLAFVLGYEDKITPKSGDFKTGILWIPGLGPFIGVGPRFFQFFWVPVSDFN